MNNSTPCALCGTTTAHRVMGRVGCACDGCIGEAAKQAIAKEKMPKQPNVTASDLCLLCGDPITKANLVAVRSPYKICHDCLMSALQRAAEPPEGVQFVQVNF
jgi:hypothetical protein